MGANNLEPETCCMGDGRRALRKVGRRGYCADHIEQAWRDAAKVNTGTKLPPSEVEEALGGSLFAADYDYVKV